MNNDSNDIKSYKTYICERLMLDPSRSNVLSFFSALGYTINPRFCNDDSLDKVQDFIMKRLDLGDHEELFMHSWNAKDKCVDVNVSPNFLRILLRYCGISDLAK